jgi:acetyltransferase-like isoleucine patch superfamily enzyme
MYGNVFTRDHMASHPNFSNFDIGDYSYGVPTVAYSNSGASLIIGKFCSIGLHVEIYLGGNHHTEWISTYPFSHLSPLFRPEHRLIQGHPATKGDVRIGNDVWIANKAVILSGVTIGDGAAIGCDALVTKDVPPYTIVAGNPAKEIKPRFPKPIIAKLLALRWWDWDIDAINDVVPLLMSEDFEGLFQFAARRAEHIRHVQADGTPGNGI